MNLAKYRSNSTNYTKIGMEFAKLSVSSLRPDTRTSNKRAENYRKVRHWLAQISLILAIIVLSLNCNADCKKHSRPRARVWKHVTYTGQPRIFIDIMNHKNATQATEFRAKTQPQIHARRNARRIAHELGQRQSQSLQEFEQRLPTSISIDGRIGTISSPARNLPNGPPPFAPTVLLPQATMGNILRKLRRTKIFKRMYKSKVYYLYLDVLRQLTILVDKISRRKMQLTEANLAAVQAVVSKLAWKGGEAMKLKWPLVMLNPSFLKEILSNPTFLVMLFHTIEVAYMSLPYNFWLKPLVNLVKQPSGEKEEQIWWRRKRIYDALNGIGSSEFEPNLRSVYFQNPGRPVHVAIPRLAKVVRTIMERPEPNPRYYKHPMDDVSNLMTNPSSVGDTFYEAHNTEEDSNTSRQPHVKNNSQFYMTHAQEEDFLHNQKHHHPPSGKMNTQAVPDMAASTNCNEESNLQDRQEWLTRLPSADQLMSQAEFDSLEEHEKESILKEAKQRFEESRLTNELIKQQSDFIESFTNGRHDNLVSATTAGNESQVREDLATLEGQLTQNFKDLSGNFVTKRNNWANMASKGVL